MQKHHNAALLVILVFVGFANVSKSQSKQNISPILGRWNVTVYDINGVYPSWFEITEQGDTLAGKFQGRHSSWRPIREIEFDGRTLRISLPAYDYEREEKDDLIFTGKIVNGRIEGVNDPGIRFRALPAPELDVPDQVRWGTLVNLSMGSDVSENWRPRSLGSPNGWKLENGVLFATPPSTDLVSKENFMDFKLHVEFKVPEKSNSGVYLRGRYEIQITDDFGKEPDSHRTGGVYGFITPTKMMIKPAGEWNSWDITLLGRQVTLVFNGQKVIDNQEIPGITGSAINSREEEPGPIMLQCHGAPIFYRNIVVTPAISDEEN
jgi:hypothetical protein